MRQEQEKAAAVAREGSLAVPRFVFRWSDEDRVCAHSECDNPLLVRATRRRTVVSLAYGKFVAVVREGACPSHPGLRPVRSRELTRLVASGSNVAYDVLVRVGVLRFLECRQLGEIQADLSRRHGVEVPVRTIGHQARRFVAYVQAVHEQSVSLLRQDMVRRGGYILHVDGTCEEGSQVLLVCLDSLSGQVLESRKIASESREEVRRVLVDVRRDWGEPLGVVQDLRSTLLKAVGEAFPGVRQFVCHYHLAADVGKDILAGHVDRLRRLFRRTKIRPKLGALCRSLREFAVEADGGDHVVGSLLTDCGGEELEGGVTPRTILGTVHALASWVLAFSRTGEGYGYPFELPYLVLYERVVKVYDALARIDTSRPAKATEPAGKLRRLKTILASVVEGEHAEEFSRIVDETRRDQKIFERFRAALRICPKGGKHRRNDEGAPATLSPTCHKEVLADLRSSLERRALRDEGAAKACRIVIDHLTKYWKYLFGHRVKTGPHSIVIPRTNNDEERLFRTVKRQCRRLHGRGHLRRDVDEMPEGTTLVQNLKNAEYCKTVYGGSDPESIATRFSKVDPRIPADLQRGWKRERRATRLPRKLEALQDLPERLGPFLAVAARELESHA